MYNKLLFKIKTYNHCIDQTVKVEYTHKLVYLIAYN